MLLLSVRTDDAIKAYPRLMELGLVQDDLFAERVFEEALGECCRFDLSREIVFRWDDQSPEDFESAAKIVSRLLPVSPVRVWVHGTEYCWPRRCAAQTGRRASCSCR